MRAFSVSDLKAPELQVARVLVPEFDQGGEPACCYVKEMTANDRDKRVDTWWEHRKENLDQKDNSGRMAWIAAACLCTEEGKWLAPSAIEVNELTDKLQEQKAAAIQRIVIAASTMNGIGDSAVERIEKK